MFNFLFGKKKQAKSFSADEQAGRLRKLSPSSALVSIKKADNEDESDPLGKAFFLRQDRKLFTQGRYIYITTPENLKSNKSQLGKKTVILQFFCQRIPYKIYCRGLRAFPPAGQGCRIPRF